MAKQNIKTTVAQFAADMLRKDDRDLMQKAHDALHDIGMDADSLRGQLEQAAAQVKVKDKHGNTVEATWPKTKLDMIVAGATRDDTPDLVRYAHEIAGQPGITANAYHIGGRLAAEAIKMPGVGADQVGDVVRGAYTAESEVEIARRKAVSAHKSMKKAIAAFMAEAEGLQSKEEMANDEEAVQDALGMLGSVINRKFQEK
jgi:hypothetical protein